MRNSIYIICLLILSGCQDVIDLKLPENQTGKLAIDATLYKDSLAQVKITKSLAYFDQTTFPEVIDALVILKDGTDIDTLQHIGGGNYIGKKIRGKVGRTYTMEVKSGNESTTATAILPRDGHRIDSIYFNEIPFLPANFTDRIVTNMWLQEPLGPGDNYLFRFEKNDTLQTRPENIDIRDDQFVDGVQLKDISVGVLLKKGDRVRVEIHSITRECYDYYFQIINNTVRQGGIFNPPPAPLKTNWSNGALGYFRVSSVVSIKGIVP